MSRLAARPTSRWPDSFWLHEPLRRVGAALLVIWLASSLTFVALQVIPGDPLQVILGPGATATPDVIAALRVEFGLDQPLWTRYTGFLSGLVSGDLGLSFRSKQPVAGLIAGQLGSSLLLTFSALALAWLLALGSILLSSRRSSWAERSGRTLEVTLASLPDFWVGLLLISLFAFKLHWFPSAGGSSFAALILPVVTLALPLAGFLAQVMRQAFEDAMAQPFVLSSRARGTSDWQVRLRHGLPHAVLPAIGLSSWAVGWLIGGSIAVEQIFARRGLGTLIVTAVGKRDYPVIMGCVVVIAAVYVVVNLLTDLLEFTLAAHLKANA